MNKYTKTKSVCSYEQNKAYEFCFRYADVLRVEPLHKRIDLCIMLLSPYKHIPMLDYDRLKKITINCIDRYIYERKGYIKRSERADFFNI